MHFYSAKTVKFNQFANILETPVNIVTKRPECIQWHYYPMRISGLYDYFSRNYNIKEKKSNKTKPSPKNFPIFNKKTFLIYQPDPKCFQKKTLHLQIWNRIRLMVKKNCLRTEKNTNAHRFGTSGERRKNFKGRGGWKI